MYYNICISIQDDFEFQFVDISDKLNIIDIIVYLCFFLKFYVIFLKLKLIDFIYYYSIVKFVIINIILQVDYFVRLYEQGIIIIYV